MEGKGIFAAMAAVMAEMTAIGKDKKCTLGESFSYRGIDDVYNAIQPLLGKHKIFVLPYAMERTSESRTTRKGANMEVVTVKMRYIFAHADGSSVEACTIGEAMDSGDKATNKAMAIAHKYAILQAFCVPTEDMEDPDAVAHSLESRERTAVRRTREKAAAENPSPATDAQRKAFFAAMRQRHGDNREEILAELSNFFGREVASSNELTKDEISEFLDALNTGREEAA